MRVFNQMALWCLIIFSNYGFSIKTLSKDAVLSVTAFVAKKIQGADLFVFPTQRCGARCPFCIGNRIHDNQNDRSADAIIQDINALVSLKVVSRIRFLGGEPFDYPALEYVLKNITLKPSITTNGFAFIKNGALRRSLNSLLKSIFISVHHYDEKKRDKLMHYKGFSNRELFDAMQEVYIPTRMNTLLIKGFVDSPQEIRKQILFAHDAKFSQLAFKELAATDAETYDYINPRVVSFNNKHFVKIATNMRKAFGKKGEGFRPKVSFSAIRTTQLSIPQLALFNNGKIGLPWNPAHALFDVDTFLTLQSNIKF